MKTKQKKLLIATHNEGKLKEFKAYLSPFFDDIISLKALKDDDEVVEDQDTYVGNAIKKAQYFYHKYKIPTIADDSGLEVDALEKYPGIYSARIANNDISRNQHIIDKLKNIGDRQASMISVIAFIDNEVNVFEGILSGIITKKPIGNQGFGYDKIFFIKHLNKTLGEISREEKLQISHRGQALNKLKRHLEMEKEI